MHDLECASNSLKILAPDFEKQKFIEVLVVYFFLQKIIKSDNERNSSFKVRAYCLVEFQDSEIQRCVY